MRITATPGSVSSPGCSTRSRYTCVPGSRPRMRHRRPGRDVDQPERATARCRRRRRAARPTESTPRSAAMAIQKSNALHPAKPAELGEVDHPEHDRIDDDRGQDRLGQLGEQGREQDQRAEDERAGGERGDRRPRPGRLVQRARRQARRDRHPLEDAGPEVGHPLGDRLLVEVDAIAVLRGERLGVAGGLGEPDQQQREGRDDDRREVFADTSSSGGSCGSGRPRGTVPTSATPRAPRSNSDGRERGRRRRARARRAPSAAGSAARG